mmetsp:Transcript_127259/g.302295  ORF Transcript_127259/g.302295 Transcript_127259/m.302295 type:complete len:314 (-) Transcript_127259:1451-2392(-)
MAAALLQANVDTMTLRITLKRDKCVVSQITWLPVLLIMVTPSVDHALSTVSQYAHAACPSLDGNVKRMGSPNSVIALPLANIDMPNGSDRSPPGVEAFSSPWPLLPGPSFAKLNATTPPLSKELGTDTCTPSWLTTSSVAFSGAASAIVITGVPSACLVTTCARTPPPVEFPAASSTASMSCSWFASRPASASVAAAAKAAGLPVVNVTVVKVVDVVDDEVSDTVVDDVKDELVDEEDVNVCVVVVKVDEVEVDEAEVDVTEVDAVEVDEVEVAVDEVKVDAVEVDEVEVELEEELVVAVLEELVVEVVVVKS